MKLQLNREQLKLIAIISMVIDHVAWGFVEFYSPLGQFLHVCGRLTIPIMSFFVVEGFKHTSDLKKYINRMVSFGFISIIPFYVFFHEEYGYRVNFIFDLLLGLLVLTTLESNLKKWQKIGLVTLLFVASMVIGGWPIGPILFMLIFYYGKDFKQKAILFAVTDISIVALLAVLISLNNIYHFSHYEWVWWDKSYQLGFMLALPLLYCYNGEKGKSFLSRYFFYLFYPAHFCALIIIKAILVEHASAYKIDLVLHICVLAVAMVLAYMILKCKPSKGQVSVLVFLAAGSVYVFGFLLEIISGSVETYHIAIMVEYFGEVICFMGLTFFAQELCKMKIPGAVYAMQLVISLLIVYAQMQTLENGFFYKSISVDHSGPFPKPILEYGPGFYLTISYVALLSLFVIGASLRAYKNGNALEKKRLKLFMHGVVFIWLPYPAKLLGLTGGYEIPGVGIAIAAFFFYMILIRYGFLDSVTLASENALDHGRDGILVLDTDYKIQYHNKQVDEIFGELDHRLDVRENPSLGPIISGKKSLLEKKGRIYEFSLETLKDNEKEHGYMLWIHDATDHFETMKVVREMATKDPLTKLYNRTYYQELIENHFHTGKGGTFLMVDMDNFKMVNDRYGHQMGDDVLKALADVFNRFSMDRMIGCRMGGDEFSAFFMQVDTDQILENNIQFIMDKFQEKIVELGMEAHFTSLSIGATICNMENPKEADFASIYNMTDKILYDVKRDGKNQFRIQKIK